MNPSTQLSGAALPTASQGRADALAAARGKVAARAERRLSAKSFRAINYNSLKHGTWLLKCAIFPFFLQFILYPKRKRVP